MGHSDRRGFVAMLVGTIALQSRPTSRRRSEFSIARSTPTGPGAPDAEHYHEEEYLGHHETP
jgi:hypothetical protein